MISTAWKTKINLIQYKDGTFHFEIVSKGYKSKSGAKRALRAMIKSLERGNYFYEEN